MKSSARHPVDILVEAIEMNLEGVALVGYTADGEHIALTSENDDHASKLSLIGWKHWKDQSTGESFRKALNS